MNTTEKDYDEIRRLGMKLHIPIPEMFWGFKVETTEQNITHQHKERGHSWLRNAYNLLVCQLCAVNASDATFGAGYINAKSELGVVRNASSPMGLPYGSYGDVENNGGGYGASANSDTSGIIVGTGTSAYDFDQYCLAAKIANGTNAGQFSYAAGNAIVKRYSANKYTVTHSRAFINNSSGTITVNEVGVFSFIGLSGSSQYLLTRDILTTPVVAVPLSKLTVSYTLSVAFPS